MCPDLQAPEVLERLPPSFCEGVDVRYASKKYASELARDVIASHEKCYARGCSQPPPSLAKLLLLYFEYMLHASKRGSCLAVRRRGPKSERAQKRELPAGPKGYLLPKYACWPNVDQGRLKERLSIEDPFETHDCPEPTRRHDCAANLSKEGMAQLLSEWRRAGAMLTEANRPEVVIDAVIESIKPREVVVRSVENGGWADYANDDDEEMPSVSVIFAAGEAKRAAAKVQAEADVLRMEEEKKQKMGKEKRIWALLKAVTESAEMEAGDKVKQAAEKATSKAASSSICSSSGHILDWMIPFHVHKELQTTKRNACSGLECL